MHDLVFCMHTVSFFKTAWLDFWCFFTTLSAGVGMKKIKLLPHHPFVDNNRGWCYLRDLKLAEQLRLT